MRIIFHVDVNNAFLSWSAVYLLQNGYDIDIRTIPSVIGGDEDKRHGIVLAKSPIAKKYDIKTAETLYLARKKCPSLKIFPPNFSFYHEMSTKLMDYLKTFTPLLEQFSVDECFMDLSNTKYLYDDILELAYKIRREVKEKFGFTVNVGVANNKLCAKMASDFEKPDKVHTLFDNEIESKMWPLPIEDLLYVGKSSASELKSMGIKTIGDLANTSENILKSHFKSRSLDMIKMARGIDDSKVCETFFKNTSISVSKTLAEDTNDTNLLHKELLDMCNQVGLRARKSNSFANVIAITYKTSKFLDYSHQRKLVNPTNDTMEIYHVVLSLYDELKIKDKFRSIGVRLSDLNSNNNEQISLFNNGDTSKKNKVQNIVDDINSKYKNTVIMPAIFYKDK